MRKTYQSITISAPVEKVWKKISDFHDMSWTNIIEKCEAVGDKSSNQVGAKRILNDAFQETLLDLDDQEYTIKYSIDDGPSPVSKNDVKNYIGVLRLLPITEENATFVEWASSWEAEDSAAEDFCHGIYVALLNDLKSALS